MKGGERVRYYAIHEGCGRLFRHTLILSILPILVSVYANVYTMLALLTYSFEEYEFVDKYDWTMSISIDGEPVLGFSPLLESCT